MTTNEGAGGNHVAGGDRQLPLHVPWSDPKPKTVSISWPDLAPLPTPTTRPKKEAPAMAEDIHGEPIGDERITYAQPPVLTARTQPQQFVGINPLPAWAIAAARLMADTESHTDPTVRSARKIAAQALEHLQVLVRAASDRGAPAETKADKKTTRKSAPRPESVGPDPKAVRAWAAENGIECGAVGRVPRAVVDAYLQAQGN